MSAPKHTPEPWEVYGDGLGIRAKVNGFRIVKCDQASRSAYENARDRAEGMEYTRGNAARIVACVNACEGIANFPDGGLKSLMLDTTVAWAEVKQQRDELAAALREVIAMWPERGHGPVKLPPMQRQLDVFGRANAALAKVPQ